MAVLGYRVRPTPRCTLMGRVGAGNWAQLEWINRDKPELAVGQGWSTGLLLIWAMGEGMRLAGQARLRDDEGVAGEADGMEGDWSVVGLV
ncbi:hypothetical protein V6N13_082118 [Hibiscus sabdariffa]